MKVDQVRGCVGLREVEGNDADFWDPAERKTHLPQDNPMRHSRQHVTETPSAPRKPTSQRGDPSVAQAAAAEELIIKQ